MESPAAETLPYRRGVGIMLFNAEGRVFVGQRLDRDDDAWQMPQGGIDEGESPAQAAMRELKEETGSGDAEIIGEARRWLSYDLPDGLRGKAWGGKYRGQTQKWYAMRFTGGDRDIDLDAGGTPEFEAWRWVDIGQLVGLIVPFKKAMYGQLVAELQDFPGQIRGAPPASGRGAGTDP